MDTELDRIDMQADTYLHTDKPVNEMTERELLEETVTRLRNMDAAFKSLSEMDFSKIIGQMFGGGSSPLQMLRNRKNKSE